MKKKALATRMAAFVMAGAMTLGMGFTALADEKASLNPETKNEVTLTKKIPVAENTYAPAAKFKFTITPTDPTGTESYKKSGVAGGLYFKEDSANKGQEIELAFAPGTLAEEYVNQNVKVAIDATKFTETGIYYYQIQETDPEYEGMTADTTARNLYVYVTKNEAGTGFNAYITGEILTTTPTDEKGGKLDELTFTNVYGKDTGTVRKLEIKKQVTGAFRNSDDEFKVQIKINQQEKNAYSNGDEKYYVVVKNGDQEISTKTITSGATVSDDDKITIKDGYTITVYGLTAGDTVYVKETDKNGYTDSYACEGGATGWTKDEDGYYNGHIATGDSAALAKVIITNEKDAVAPTGIVTEYAPYILLVAAAGAFAVLFLRRKKEEF